MTTSEQEGLNKHPRARSAKFQVEIDEGADLNLKEGSANVIAPL
jgi:hypothetical protein